MIYSAHATLPPFCTPLSSTSEDKPQGPSNEIPPQVPFACNNEKQLRKMLEQSKVIDDSGSIIQSLKALSPLTEQDTKRLHSDLAKVQTFSRGGVASSFSIKDLLNSITIEYGQFIESIHLVGGGVNCYLSREFLENNLKINDLEHLKGILPESLFERLNAPSSDLDIRITLIDKAYEFERGPFKGIKGLQESIRRHLCSFISSKMVHEVNPQDVWNYIFKKKGFLDPARLSSLYSLKTAEGFRLDLSVCHNKIDRKFLFRNDAMAIDIGDLVALGNTSLSPPLAPIVTYKDAVTQEDGGWPALLAKLLCDIGIVDPDTTNILAFPLSLVKKTKGFSSYAADPDTTLLPRYIELLKIAPPPKEKQNKQVQSSRQEKEPKDSSLFVPATPEQYPDLIYNQFTHCVRNHLRKDSLGAFFLSFSLCRSLEGYFAPPDKTVSILFNKMNGYIEKLGETDLLGSFAKTIIELCAKGGLPFESIAHILSLQCIIRDMAGIPLQEGEECSTTVQDGVIHLQLKWKGRSLTLPFDPLKSIEIISSLQKPQHESVLALLNTFPLASSSKVASSVSQEKGLDFDELQNQCIKLLKNPQTYPFGYQLWIASQRQCQANAHTPLEYLLNAILENGPDQIFDLLKIHDLPESQEVFLLTILKALENKPKRSEIVRECIHAMICHSDDEIKATGWKMYNNLLQAKDPTRALVTQELFLRAQSYSTARRFFEQLALSGEEQIKALQKLLDLAFSDQDPLEKENALQKVSLWAAQPGTSSGPQKTDLWLRACKHYLESDPKKSFLLWKRGCQSKIWVSLSPALKVEMEVYLIALLDLMDEKEREEVLATLVATKDLSEEGKRAVTEALTCSIDLKDHKSISALLAYPQKRAFLKPGELLECHISCLEAKIKANASISFKSLETDIKEILQDLKPLNDTDQTADTIDRLLVIMKILVEKNDPLLTIPLLLEPLFHSSSETLSLLDSAMKKLLASEMCKKTDGIATLTVRLAQSIFGGKEVEDKFRKTCASYVLTLLEKLTGMRARSNLLSQSPGIAWEEAFCLVEDSQCIPLLTFLKAFSISFVVKNLETKTKLFNAMIESLDIDAQSFSNVICLYKDGMQKWALKAPITAEESAFQKALIDKLYQLKRHQEAEAWIKRCLTFLDQETLLTFFKNLIEKKEFLQVFTLNKIIEESKPPISSPLKELAKELFRKICETPNSKEAEILLKERSLFTPCSEPEFLKKQINLYIKALVTSSQSDDLKAALRLLIDYKIEDIETWELILSNEKLSESRPSLELAWNAYNENLKDESFFLHNRAHPSRLFLPLLERLKDNPMPGRLITNPELLVSIINKLIDEEQDRVKAVRIIIESALLPPLTLEARKTTLENIRIFLFQDLIISKSNLYSPDSVFAKMALMKAYWSCEDPTFFLEGYHLFLQHADSPKVPELKQLIALVDVAGEHLLKYLQNKKAVTDALSIKVVHYKILVFFQSIVASQKVEIPPPLKFLESALKYSSDILVSFNTFTFLDNWISTMQSVPGLEGFDKIDIESEKLFKSSILSVISFFKNNIASEWSPEIIAIFDEIPERIDALKQRSNLLCYPSSDDIEEISGKFLEVMLQKALKAPSQERLEKVLDKDLFLECLPKAPNLDKLKKQCIDTCQDLIITCLTNKEIQQHKVDYYEMFLQIMRHGDLSNPINKSIMIDKLLKNTDVDSDAADLIVRKIVSELACLAFSTKTKQFKEDRFLSLLHMFSDSPLCYSYGIQNFLDILAVQAALFYMAGCEKNIRSLSATPQKLKESLKFAITADILETTQWENAESPAGTCFKDVKKGPLLLELIEEWTKTKNIHYFLKAIKTLEHAQRNRVLSETRDMKRCYATLFQALSGGLLTSFNQEEKTLLANTFLPFLSKYPAAKELLNYTKQVKENLLEYQTSAPEDTYEHHYQKLYSDCIDPTLYKGLDKESSPAPEDTEILLLNENTQAPIDGAIESRWSLVKAKIEAFQPPLQESCSPHEHTGDALRLCSNLNFKGVTRGKQKDLILQALNIKEP